MFLAFSMEELSQVERLVRYWFNLSTTPCVRDCRLEVENFAIFNVVKLLNYYIVKII